MRAIFRHSGPPFALDDPGEWLATATAVPPLMVNQEHGPTLVTGDKSLHDAWGCCSAAEAQDFVATRGQYCSWDQCM